MQVSRMQMRTEFERNKGVATSGPEFAAMVAGIGEATDMLRHEIVRGDLNADTGRYGTCERLKICEKNVNEVSENAVV
jgi:hypothetical protein